MADLVDAGPDLDLPALELDAAKGRAQAQQLALNEMRSTGPFVALLENPAADDAVPNGWRYLAGQAQRMLGVLLVVETRAGVGHPRGRTSGRDGGRPGTRVTVPAVRQPTPGPGATSRARGTARPGQARTVASEPWSSLPAHCVRSHPALRANRCVGDQTRHGPPP